MLLAQRVKSVMRRDNFLLSLRRAEQISRIMQGIVGLQLRKLLAPILLLFLRKRRRAVTVSLRAQMTSSATNSSLADFCLLHPFLAPLGKEGMAYLVQKARRQCYFPDDVILCPGEPSRSVGIVLCTTGKLTVRCKKDAGANRAADLIGNLRLSTSGPSSSMLQGDFVGFAADGDTTVTAPVILGALRLMTDMSNPHLVVALTTVDAFLIPYSLVHDAIAGRSATQDRRFTTQQASPLSAPLSLATTATLTVTGVASADVAGPSGTVASPRRRPRCALEDPSLFLVSRLLAVQTQFRMSSFCLMQSWWYQGIPEELQGEVASNLECRCFAPGETIIERGKLPQGIWFLRRGTVEVYGKGNSFRCALRAGCVIGERSAVFNDRCRESIVAATFCDFWMLPKAELDRLRSNPVLHASWNNTGIAMATQWLQNVRLDEQRRERRAHVEYEHSTPQRSGFLLAVPDVYHKGAGARSPRVLSPIHTPATVALAVHPLPVVPHATTLTSRLVLALRTVPYLADGPDEMLLRICAAVEPRVFLPHTALTSSSSWCSALYILTKGAATIQHGLTTRSAPQHYPWHYAAGSCVGMECLIEHRTICAACSVTMVEAWAVPRSALRLVLREFDRLADAEAVVESVLADLQFVLSQPLERRQQQNLGGAVPPNSASRYSAPATALPSRQVSPTRRNISPPLTVPSNHSRQPTSRRVSPTRITGGNATEIEDVEPVYTIHIAGVDMLVDLENADINRGIVGMQTCLVFLSNIETIRHERYALMFPEATERIFRQRHEKEEAQRQELDRHTEKYKQLAEQYLSQPGEMFVDTDDVGAASGGDAPSIKVGRRSTIMSSNAAADIASSIAATFDEANQRADEVRQQMVQQATAVGWADDDDDRRDEEAMEDSSRRLGMSRSFTRSAAIIQQHIYPHVYSVVESSELVGEQSSWLLQLLGRRGGVWGYLEGSHPSRGTMVSVAAPLRTAAFSASINLGGSLSASHHSATTSRPSEPASTRRLSTSQSRRTSHGEHPRASLLPTVAHYKPSNPHSYDAQLPTAVLKVKHQPTSSFRTLAMARAVLSKWGASSNSVDDISVPSPKFEDVFDNDVIGKVLHHSQAEDARQASHENRRASVAASHKGNSARRQPATQQHTRQEEQSGHNEGDTANADYFEEEWEMMMRGEGIYGDEGQVQALRLAAALRKRPKPKPPAVAPQVSQRRRLSAAQRRVSLAADGPVEGRSPIEPALGSASDSNGAPSSRDHRRSTALFTVPLSTPFLDGYQAYLKQATLRLEHNTTKAVTELEKEEPRVADDSDDNNEQHQPSQPISDPRRLRQRQPQRRVASASTTRSALILPATTPRPPPRPS